MMTPVQFFPHRPRQFRMARKITQTRVAELLTVSPRVYTRWENGDAVPRFATVVKIATNSLGARIPTAAMPAFATRSCTGSTRKSIIFPMSIRKPS